MIEIDKLRVVRHGITLLPNASARVPAGGALVLRGGNGAGKTTLLRVLAGLEAPSDGTALIAGQRPNPRDPEFRRRVAALISAPPLADDLTFGESLALVAETWRRSERSAMTSPEQVLDELGLEHLAARFPHEVSSGQHQLFLIALALVRPSQVLLVDEPEQRLDPTRMRLVVDALRARRDAGAALVVATHSDVVAQGLVGQSLDLGGAAAA